MIFTPALLPCPLNSVINDLLMGSVEIALSNSSSHLSYSSLITINCEFMFPATAQVKGERMPCGTVILSISHVHATFMLLSLSLSLPTPKARTQERKLHQTPFDLSMLTLLNPKKAKQSGNRKKEEDMQKLCTCDTASLLLDDLLSLCAFLASHPLHSAYLLFFLPYLSQLLSFLSPLLLSTAILFLLLLTLPPYLDEAPQSPPQFLGKTCCIVLGILKDKFQSHRGIDQLEQFASMFLSPIDDASPSSRESAAEAVFGEFSVDACSAHETEAEAANVGSNAVTGERDLPGAAEHARSDSIGDLQRYGSAKREKEWKRTLACKLYEERMTHRFCKEREVSEEGEEMDLLWEAYEANAGEGRACERKKKEKKKVKSTELDGEGAEEEEKEEDERFGQLCCLQALRLSAGKMNLGIGKRNLMKISKVLKGMKKFSRGGSKG